MAGPGENKLDGKNFGDIKPSPEQNKTEEPKEHIYDNPHELTSGRTGESVESQESVYDVPNLTQSRQPEKKEGDYDVPGQIHILDKPSTPPDSIYDVPSNRPVKSENDYAEITPKFVDYKTEEEHIYDNPHELTSGRTGESVKMTENSLSESRNTPPPLPKSPPPPRPSPHSRNPVLDKHYQETSSPLKAIEDVRNHSGFAEFMNVLNNNLESLSSAAKIPNQAEEDLKKTRFRINNPNDTLIDQTNNDIIRLYNNYLNVAERHPNLKLQSAVFQFANSEDRLKSTQSYSKFLHEPMDGLSGQVMRIPNSNQIVPEFTQKFSTAVDYKEMRKEKLGQFYETLQKYLKQKGVKPASFWGKTWGQLKAQGLAEKLGTQEKFVEKMSDPDQFQKFLNDLKPSVLQVLIQILKDIFVKKDVSAKYKVGIDKSEIGDPEDFRHVESVQNNPLEFNDPDSPLAPDWVKKQFSQKPNFLAMDPNHGNKIATWQNTDQEQERKLTEKETQKMFAEEKKKFLSEPLAHNPDIQKSVVGDFTGEVMSTVKEQQQRSSEVEDLDKQLDALNALISRITPVDQALRKSLSDDEIDLQAKQKPLPTGFVPPKTVRTFESGTEEERVMKEFDDINYDKPSEVPSRQKSFKLADERWSDEPQRSAPTLTREQKEAAMQKTINEEQRLNSKYSLELPTNFNEESLEEYNKNLYVVNTAEELYEQNKNSEQEFSLPEPDFPPLPLPKDLPQFTDKPSQGVQKPTPIRVNNTQSLTRRFESSVDDGCFSDPESPKIDVGDVSVSDLKNKLNSNQLTGGLKPPGTPKSGGRSRTS